MTRAPEDAFAFGRNWQRFVSDYLTEERERIAAESLMSLLQVDLRGKRFLDIGAGSGLFSLCAHKLGAAEVVSVDVDPHSVESCRRLKASVEDPESWTVLHGSILDDELVEQLAPADVVYSWGVLHHTGDMYPAIRNAARLLNPQGLLAIAIYNRFRGRVLNSERWATIKRTYNRAPAPARWLMLAVYEATWCLRQLRYRRNPWREAAEYKRSRGMALRTDLIDWLGGYPYEFATVDEIVAFCREACGLEPVRVLPVEGDGSGNNEFVFRGSATAEPAGEAR